jgi:hypothetical protein
VARPVFLDLDNTLIDNDAAKAALRERIAAAVPSDVATRFWQLYEIVRADEDYIDFPVTLQRLSESHPADAARISRILDDLPYRDFVQAGAFELIDRLWRSWTPAILSDGDPVFQPRKIERSGLAAAVRGNVLIFAHKERHLDEATRRFPGERPVFADDKAPILGHIERAIPDALTVHVRQGRYGTAPPDPGDPAPDLEIDRIADLDQVIAGR